jgi:hypothetical protein
MVVDCSSEITYYYRVVDSIWLTVDIEKSSLDVDLIWSMLNYAPFSLLGAAVSLFGWSMSPASASELITSRSRQEPFRRFCSRLINLYLLFNRSQSSPWFFKQLEMQKFTTKIVHMMKSERLFEWQGGPIILSQVCVQSCNHDVLLICVDSILGIPLDQTHLWILVNIYRLRMSLGPWSGIRVSLPRPTLHGQLTWPLRSTQVFHGSCAKRMMPQIQLYVLHSLALLIWRQCLVSFNALGSFSFLTIVQERKENESSYMLGVLPSLSFPKITSTLTRYNLD